MVHPTPISASVVAATAVRSDTACGSASPPTPPVAVAVAAASVATEEAHWEEVERHGGEGGARVKGGAPAADASPARPQEAAVAGHHRRTPPVAAAAAAAAVTADAWRLPVGIADAPVGVSAARAARAGAPTAARTAAAAAARVAIGREQTRGRGGGRNAERHTRNGRAVSVV